MMYVEAHRYDDKTIIVNVWDDAPGKDGSNNKLGSGNCYGVSISTEGEKIPIGVGLAHLQDMVCKKLLGFDKGDLMKAVGTLFT